MSKIIKHLASVLAVILTFFGISVTTPYDSPIDTVNGGDPFIVEDSGNTYYTYTTGGGVDIVKIKSFDNAETIERKTVLWAGEHGTKGDIWAPEIHKIGDRWYILATALFNKDAVPRGTMPLAKEYKENDDYYRYTFVLESNSEDIFGDYSFKGFLAPDGLNNLDGTYLHKDGRLYYVCSVYKDIAHQAIYICEMENPYTLKEDSEGKNNAVEISYPKYYWEKRGWYVNEGPAVLYKDGDIFILYSASGYYSNHYCMGMLTLEGDDVLSTESWNKSKTRVSYHQPLKNIYNAGHCSFLYRENGDIYMVYHATQTLDFFESSRLTYIKKLEFRNGKPYLK